MDNVNLEKTSEYRIYVAGARQMLLSLLDADILNAYRGKEPMLEVGVIHSRRKIDYHFHWHLLKAIRTDNELLNAFVTGNLRWEYVTVYCKGREYSVVRFYAKGEEQRNEKVYLP